ncbi:hypothetical protein FOL47_010875 [Perkinsus chesapeaki]|uniref:Uncharacterized protein n=1 Tax=Perkinsus chesapeaki TaxID=330153 RepID=A0A7J6MPC1_PERCH|nr:hypothetical protein FOL47_010875 [Perkinsus chesapeaki]
MLGFPRYSSAATALTNLLTKESIWQTDVAPTSADLRVAAQKIAELVNARGTYYPPTGWTIMGWNKAGQSVEEGGLGTAQSRGSFKEIETVHVLAVEAEGAVA